MNLQQKPPPELAAINRRLGKRIGQPQLSYQIVHLIEKIFDSKNEIRIIEWKKLGE